VNLPDAKKTAQGRTPAAATVLIDHSSGKTFTLEQLAAWAPPTPVAANAKRSKTNAAGKGNASHPLVDMKAVQAAEIYDDLPEDLRSTFEAHCKRDRLLRALWETGKLPPGRRDDSGSGYSLALAERLKRFGKFTATQFGQLLWVWKYGRLHEKIDARMIARDWERAVNDTADGLEPVAGPEVKFDGGEPVDLWADTSRPAELPQGVVPEIIERLARGGGRRLGVEPGALAAAYVTAFGSLVPAGNRLQMRQLDTDWTVAPTLWFMVVGDPATRKSPLLSYATAPVRPVEAKWRRDFAAAQQRRRSVSSAPPEKTEGQLASGEPDQSSEAVFCGGEGVEVGDVPFRQKIVNDATTESIGSLLEENPDGLLYFADELSGWIGNMDAYKARPGKDRPFWLTAKEGGPYTINRQGRGRTVIPNCAVSVLGGIQPDKIRALADNLDDDGLLQRFMPILIDQRGRGVDEAPDQGLKAEAEELALALARSEPNRLFKFSPEADAERLAIEDFAAWESERPSLPPAMRQWLNKLPNEFGRIALVFHFIEHASRIRQPEAAIPELISRETAQRARRFLMEFVFSHARAFYEGVLGRSNVDVHARWIAGFILARERVKVEARDIYRVYQPLKKPERRGDLLAAMYSLEMLGWVKPIGVGRRGEPNWWAVNPEVHQRFADRAAAEKTHRAEVQEKIAQAGAERRAAA
jgi:hypothetical protein